MTAQKCTSHNLEVLTLEPHSWRVSNRQNDLTDARSLLAFVEKVAEERFSIIMVAPHPGEQWECATLGEALELLAVEDRQLGSFGASGRTLKPFLSR